MVCVVRNGGVCGEIWWWVWWDMVESVVRYGVECGETWWSVWWDMVESCKKSDENTSSLDSLAIPSESPMSRTQDMRVLKI